MKEKLTKNHLGPVLDTQIIVRSSSLAQSTVRKVQHFKIPKLPKVSKARKMRCNVMDITFFPIRVNQKGVKIKNWLQPESEISLQQESDFKLGNNYEVKFNSKVGPYST